MAAPAEILCGSLVSKIVSTLLKYYHTLKWTVLSKSEVRGYSEKFSKREHIIPWNKNIGFDVFSVILAQFYRILSVAFLIVFTAAVFGFEMFASQNIFLISKKSEDDKSWELGGYP